ncbi:MAG TPA: ATP-binding cassette domain-containing protein [Candidatus Deferrimicrobiaceae bacterium]|nr:ATP-binding cassette domain-containing protein [Candidatus Deferrimicrobiaceae bacterium]
MTDLLRAEGIEKSFGTVRVLRGIDLSVGKGEVVGLFGPNGAGKTVLANVLSGLIFPDRGTIFFEGKEITRIPMDARFRAGLTRTFQIPGPYPTLTVVESVRVALLCGDSGRRGKSRSSRELEEEVESVLHRTGLFPQRFWLASKLSQGCLRRLEFARSISCRPKLILLDEVFSALSEKDEAELAALLRSLHGNDGVSFLLISHNPLLLEGMCNRVVAIEDGRVAWEGKSADLAAYLPVAGAHNHGQ